MKEWFLGTNLLWGMVDYPKMQLKREIIFGFTDVLGILIPKVLIQFILINHFQYTLAV